MNTNIEKLNNLTKQEVQKMTAIEKLDELKANPEFAEKIAAANSKSELVSVMKEYGIEITDVDAENILVNAKKIIDADGEIPDEMLDDVHGGIAMATLGAILVFTQVVNFACTIAQIKLNSMRRR